MRFYLQRYNTLFLMNFYFPVLFLIPDFEAQEIEVSSFTIAKRQWQTSIFDLASLATKHKLHLPYQSMDVFLGRCNSEICIRDVDSLDAAKEQFQSLRLALYLEGISPFLSPFVTNYSINEYSGINSREGGASKKNLPAELQEGLTSETGTVEAWPFELSFTCITPHSGLQLSETQFNNAVSKAKQWEKLQRSAKNFAAIRSIAVASPTISPMSQSHLHIWSGLEALFPSVQAELSFKISLYLSQLISSKGERLKIYEEARSAYNLRSSITHGSRQDISKEEWITSWELLMKSINAILIRGKMPTEKELLAELLFEEA